MHTSSSRDGSLASFIYVGSKYWNQNIFQEWFSKYIIELILSVGKKEKTLSYCIRLDKYSHWVGELEFLSLLPCNETAWVLNWMFKSHWEMKTKLKRTWCGLWMKLSGGALGCHMCACACMSCVCARLCACLPACRLSVSGTMFEI